MIKSIRSSAWFGVLPLFVALASQNSADPAFGAWRRISETPIISSRGNGWESAGTFNPAVIERDGKIVMLYRAKMGRAPRASAMAKARRHPFHAASRAGFLPAEEYEKDGGVEILAW